MNIKDTGYTDSYGGLPSALEARALSAKGEEDHKHKRINDIAEAIKHQASRGDKDCWITLSEEECITLAMLGYVVESCATSSRISWEAHSPSCDSTKSTVGEKQDSSSGEDVETASAVSPPPEML